MVSFRFYALLTLIFALGVGIALDIGGRQTAPPDSSLIARENCFVPCTFGIVPGTTERRDAQFAIEQVSAYAVLPEGRINFVIDDAAARQEQFMGTVAFDFGGGQRVSVLLLIRAHPSADLGQLSDLLLAGYTPRRVLRTCSGVLPRMMALTFGFEDRLSVVLELDEGLTPDTPFSLLEVRAPNVNYDSALANITCPIETTWQGFAPLWKYFQAAQ